MLAMARHLIKAREARAILVIMGEMKRTAIVITRPDVVDRRRVDANTQTISLLLKLSSNN
jgi:hypothetical protein